MQDHVTIVGIVSYHVCLGTYWAQRSRLSISFTMLSGSKLFVYGLLSLILDPNPY